MSLTDEWYLHTRLKLRGQSPSTFDGLTDFESRREKTRHVIREGHLDSEECWKVKGVSQTFAQAFAAVYQEQL